VARARDAADALCQEAVAKVNPKAKPKAKTVAREKAALCQEADAKVNPKVKPKAKIK
jgi:hypothetical protein